MMRAEWRRRWSWPWAKRLPLAGSRRSLVVSRWSFWIRMRFVSLFRLAGVIAILAVAALPCFAGEVAVLRNGFSIRHERREVVGDVTRLYVSADRSSFVDVPTAEIEHFEAAPELPSSPSSRPASG